MAFQTTHQNRAAVIALVGPEATGKSTLALELENWLAATYPVRVVHVGKPPATWLTFPLHALLPIARFFFPGCRTSRLKGYVMSTDQVNMLGVDMPTQPEKIRWSTLMNALWNLCIAWERRQLLVQSHKAAAQNTFIVCDRYASNRPGALDSARLSIETRSKGVLSAIYKRLSKLEHYLYQQIPAPDIVLQLNVSFETALQRNRDRIKADKEGDGYMANRRLHSQNWDRMGDEIIHYIDTEPGLDSTIRDVIQAVENTLYEW